MYFLAYQKERDLKIVHGPFRSQDEAMSFLRHMSERGHTTRCPDVLLSIPGPTMVNPVEISLRQPNAYRADDV